MAVDLLGVPDGHRQVDDVAVLRDEVGRGDLGDTHAADGHGAGDAGMSMSLSGRPAQLGATGRSIIATRALGSTQSSSSEASGTSLRSTRSIVHWTVAIVVMPRRS